MNSILKPNFQALCQAFLLTLIILVPSSRMSATELASNDILAAYPTKKVSMNTWAIFGPKDPPNKENRGFMNNPAFVVTDKSVVVIDPGSSVQVGRSLIARIKKITDKPITHIFNSHIHGDHWLATDAISQVYPNVIIYAHPMMIEEAKAGEGESWIKVMNNLTEGATDGTKVVLPTHALEDQQIVDVDNISIKSHLSELSHTKTDAMFEIMQDKILITGDNSFNKRMPRMDDGSYVGNIDTMENALAFRCRYHYSRSWTFRW